MFDDDDILDLEAAGFPIDDDYDDYDDQNGAGPAGSESDDSDKDGQSLSEMFAPGNREGGNSGGGHSVGNDYDVEYRDSESVEEDPFSNDHPRDENREGEAPKRIDRK